MAWRTQWRWAQEPRLAGTGHDGGPRGRKPASWSIQRGVKTRGRTRLSRTCLGGGWQTGTGQRYTEMLTHAGTETLWGRRPRAQHT